VARYALSNEVSMKTILLADDDKAIRETLGKVLVLEQYSVIFASTGREAAEKFISHIPDLVLLDLSMPDRDGWDAFDLMKSTHPSVPVVVITAKPHQSERAATVGVAALMEKPLDIPLLLKAIRDLLAKTETKPPMRLAAA
jgi:two-component system, OmpR family, response regulator MprA